MNENNEQLETASSSQEADAASFNKKGGFVKYLKGGIITTYIVAFVIMLVGSILGGLLVGKTLDKLGLLNDDHPVMVTACEYLSFIGIWIIMLIVILIGRKTEYIRKILPQVTRRSVIMFIAGLFIVGGLNFICIIAAILHKDIFLYFNSFDIIPLIFLLISVCIQSSAEELICRGFIYRRIEACYKHPAVAIIGNSLFFALLHLGNDGVTALSLLNIMLAGLLFGLALYYTGSIAFAFAGHTGWNFCQSIIFGLPNSGAVFPYSLMKLESSNARDSFFYNSGFGIEGTVFSVIVLGIACTVIIILGQMNRQKAKNDNNT